MFDCKFNFDLDDLTESRNVAEMMEKDDRDKVAGWVIANFDMDRISRAAWEEKMEKAMRMAMQLTEEKTFPWPKASNVKFPLITIAALQYHSRAYPALVPSPDIVHCTPVGTMSDAPPVVEKKLSAALRVSEHMNWQLTEEMPEWEQGQDKLFLVQSIMGTALKKVYFDEGKQRNVSELVLPQDFIISYFTKDLETSPRFTHVYTWDSNTLHEKIVRGDICETDLTPPRSQPIPFGLLTEVKNENQGTTQPSNDEDNPYYIYEQSCWIDLDGDGYKEPYTAFVRADSKELLRLVSRWLPSGVEFSKKDPHKVVKITPENHWEKYEFIPSPDGGWYGMGFGHLLGPINASVDASINQLIDAGTLKNAGGGFLGRGAKVRGGSIQFKPAEWFRVDATGDDLRKNIFPLPVPEPSPVLFQLLSLLIDYGQRVAGAPDVVQGQNPGQNTPAETSRTMLEQGIKVFSGIYKRTYRSMKGEFKKLYRLNSLFLDQTAEFLSPRTGLPMKVLKMDYELPASALRPAADPNYMSDAQRMNQAQALVQRASPALGYDMRQVDLFYLRAWKIPGAETFIPVGQDGQNAIQGGQDPKVQVEQLKQQGKQQLFQMETQLKLMELMEEHELNKAKIMQLEAQAASFLAEADGKKEGHQLAALDAALGIEKARSDSHSQSLRLLHETMKHNDEMQMRQKELDLQGAQLAAQAKEGTSTGGD